MITSENCSGPKSQLTPVSSIAKIAWLKSLLERAKSFETVSPELDLVRVLVQALLPLVLLNLTVSPL